METIGQRTVETIFFHESRQIAIRIQHIGVDVLAINLAVSQRRQHVRCLFGSQQLRTDDCDLPFQHFVKMLNLQFIVCEFQQVVRMKQSVVASAQTNGLIQKLDTTTRKIANPRSSSTFVCVAAQAFAVKHIAVTGAGRLQLIYEFPAAGGHRSDRPASGFAVSASGRLARKMKSLRG